MRKSRNRGKPAEFDPRQPPEIPGVTDLTLIGSGGSASVYKGQETALHRPVAVKILHAQLRDAKERSDFEGECRRAGQVGEHRYAADVYRPGFAADWPFLVMRYYARGSLASTLGFARQRPAGEAITTCASVACALQYAHNLSIVHRDVKPENILADAYGDPVLTDFGISTDLDGATRALRHAMTPAYAAPEVLQHGGGWPVSDVWALAATLYALLAGRPPFYDPRRGDPQANLRALTGPLPPLERPDVAGHVVDTLARALIGRHDARTPSAQRFAEELNADLALLGLPPVPVRIEPGTGPSAPGYSASPGRPVAPAEAFDRSAPPLSPVPDRPESPYRTESGLRTTSLPVGDHSGYRPAAPLAEPPAPAAPSGAPAGRYVTEHGFRTTSLPSGGPNGYGRAAPLAPGPEGQWPHGYDTTNTTNSGQVTSHLGTQYAYRPPEQPTAKPARRTVQKRAIAIGGGVAVVAFLTAAYLMAAPKHPSASQRTGTTPTATASASTGTAPQTVEPPQAVTATLVAGTSSVRLSWRNVGPHADDPTVVVSMGAGSGYKPRAVPNQSPQVISGLSPMQPYCFAIGYYVAPGDVAYSAVTASSCVNGGHA
jgi:serine/threonine protein kinase